jgi:glycosyltransferase involved in cell wall biosynthesis
MRLAVISHTEHYIDANGFVVGWGPTVREINHLSDYFEMIYHVACLHIGPPPQSSLGYIGDNIKFVPIPPSGGNTVRAKLSVLQTLPIVLSTVNGVISKVDSFQLRLPTGMGNYLLPWLMFKKPQARFWVKYAGNWTQKNPPLGYAFQRWILKENFLKCKITINGHWPNQPSYVLSFENPCLTDEERIDGALITKSKNFGGKLDFVFVGQLTESKGVGRIIEAFLQIKNRSRIGLIHFVGDGPERKRYERLASEAKLNCRFHGFLPKGEVNKVLALSHVILLPSESEGFPKAIAEGANYGCIPIVSNTSCIPQYIENNRTGFILSDLNTKSLISAILNLCSLPYALIKDIAINAHVSMQNFTYSQYYKKIFTEIISE